jgi:hypothetical protein
MCGIANRSLLTVSIVVLGNSSSACGQTFPDVAKLPVVTELPDPLVMFGGGKVASRDEWFAKRRPELLALFSHYMYGVAPPAPKKIDATVSGIDRAYLGGAATRKLVTIKLGPADAPPLNVLLVVPNKRSGPAPTFVGLNFCGNHALLRDPEIPLPTTWMPDNCQGCKEHRATDAGRGTQVDVWAIEQTIGRGYAVAACYTGDIDPDRPDFGDGVHPHYLKPGQSQPGPHEWGTIAAWAWGISRIVDYLVTDADIDAKRIAVVGHSRLGKTALVAAAYDERIALAIPHQAGCGGTAPSRGKIGESVKQINDRFPHWFNDTFTKFNDQPERLPFDQHSLVALCAPRPVLLSNAEEDTWANPEGQFEVLKGADPVYRLVAGKGLEAKAMPAKGKLVDSVLGYYIRPGKHSMTKEDWRVFLDFADRNLRAMD